MLWTITAKEFLSNIVSFRFLVAFILCMTLIPLSAYVLRKDYEERLANYQSLVQKHREEIKDAKVYSDLLFDGVNIDRAPEVLSIFSAGFDKKLGNTVRVSHGEVAAVATGYGRENPLLSFFPSFDVATILQVILSLLALLFAYDTISGELERGTLALTLSNAVPRHVVLLGKYIGGMLSLLVPLTCGLLVGLLVVETSPLVVLTSSDWIGLGLIFLSTLIYVSAFFSIGMLISTRTTRSATTLMFLLFFWVVFVMLLPNASTYLAVHALPVERETIIDQKVDALREEFFLRVADFAKKHPPQGRRSTLYSMERWYVFTRILEAPNYMMFYNKKLIEYSEPLRMEYADRIWELYRRRYDALKRQADLAKNISRLSLAWTYYNATASFAGTNVDAYLRFLEQARRYREELIRYVKDKGGFGFAFFTRKKENEFLTLQQFLEKRKKVVEEMMAGRYKGWDNVKPLDLSDLPRFEFNDDPMANINAGLLDLTILILLNVIFFMGTYVSFLRKPCKI